MCGKNECRMLSTRYKAVGGGSQFILIPAKPKSTETPLQRQEAKFNEIIREQYCLGPGTDGGKLHILHWPKIQRPPLIENDKKSEPYRRRHRGLLMNEHIELQRQMQKDGILTERDTTDGNLYFNKPGNIEDAMIEVQEMEIDFWLDHGTLTEHVSKRNGTTRSTGRFRGMTLQNKLSSETQFFHERKTEICPDETGKILNTVPYWVNSRSQNRHDLRVREGREIVVELNMNDLGAALIPIPPTTMIRPAKENRPHPSCKHRCIQTFG